MTKNQHSEFDDRIGIVHLICKSQFSAQNRICRQQFEVCTANEKKKKNSVQNLMTELELYTEFVSHNVVHKTN